MVRSSDCFESKAQDEYFFEIPWKIRKLLLWRYFCATWLCCLLQYLLLGLYLLWLHLDVTNTSNWMGSVISGTFFSIYTWVAIQPLFLLLALYGLFVCRAYNVQPRCFKTRLGHLTGEIYGKLMLLAVLLAASSYQSWLYRSYGKSNGWSNEFLLIYGSFCGFYYFMGVHLRNRRLVELPVVRLRLHVALDLEFCRCFKRALRQVLPPTIWFAAIYWPWTAYINGFWVLLEQPKMLGTASCVGIFILANLHMVRACYALILNLKLPLVIKLANPCKSQEMYLHAVLLEQFYYWFCRMLMAPIGHTMGVAKLELTFAETLNTQFVHGFQLQAAKDFFELMSSPTHDLTTQLFQLSGVRNSCKTWATLCNVLLEMLAEFVNKMENCFDAPDMVCPMQETVAEYLRRRQQPGLRSLMPTPTRHIYIHRSSLIMRKFVAWKLRWQQCLPRFTVDKLYQLRHELQCAQPLVWIMQGLVIICLRSLKADNHGVLQEDLPRILEALLNVEKQLFHARKIQLHYSSKAAPLGANYTMLCNANARCLQQLLATFATHLEHLGEKHPELRQRLEQRKH